MKQKRFYHSQAGFTLTELLVVIVIIGILATLTIPRFTNVTTRAKATEAKLMLKQVYNLQKVYYLEHDRFAPSLEIIGFEQETVITQGGSARYLVELKEVSHEGFTAIATSVVDYNKNGIMNVWSIDHEGELTQLVAD